MSLTPSPSKNPRKHINIHWIAPKRALKFKLKKNAFFGVFKILIAPQVRAPIAAKHTDSLLYIYRLAAMPGFARETGISITFLRNGQI